MIVSELYVFLQDLLPPFPFYASATAAYEDDEYDDFGVISLSEVENLNGIVERQEDYEQSTGIIALSCDLARLYKVRFSYYGKLDAI